MDTVHSQQKVNKALLSLMAGPAALAGVSVLSINTDSTLGNYGILKQSKKNVEIHEGMFLRLIFRISS